MTLASVSYPARSGAPVGEEVARHGGHHQHRRTDSADRDARSRAARGRGLRRRRTTRPTAPATAPPRDDVRKTPYAGSGIAAVARAGPPPSGRIPPGRPAATAPGPGPRRARSSNRAGSSAVRVRRGRAASSSSSGNSDGTRRLPSASRLSATSPIAEPRQPGPRAARGRGHHHEGEHPGVTRPRAWCRRRLRRRRPPQPIESAVNPASARGSAPATTASPGDRRPREEPEQHARDAPPTRRRRPATPVPGPSNRRPEGVVASVPRATATVTKCPLERSERLGRADPDDLTRRAFATSRDSPYRRAQRHLPR